MLRRLAIGASLLAVVAGPTVLAADPVRPMSPTQAVRHHVDEMIAIVTNASLTPAERHEAARAAVARTFDIPELSRRALGEHWARLTATQREQVTSGLRALMTAAYESPMANGLAAGIDRRSLVARIERLRTRVHYLGESISSTVASVTMSLTHAGRDLPLQVSMIQRGRDWRISDLVVDGVRLSDNLRAQIAHLTRGADYGELLDRLKAREESAMTAPSAASGSPSP
jgi:ABC-type transporter MlaC component